MQNATMSRTLETEPMEPVRTRDLAPLGVVAASFYDRKHANDAVVDLRMAGFGHSALALAYPTDADGRTAPVAPQEHSWFWKLRQRHEQDLHERGAEQMSADPGTVPADGSAAEHVPVDPEVVGLGHLLELFGASSPNRIAILNHDMGNHGALLVIKCGGRAREVEAILEKNAGTIRTEVVTSPLETEAAPSDSLPQPIR